MSEYGHKIDMFAVKFKLNLHHKLKEYVNKNQYHYWINIESISYIYTALNEAFDSQFKKYRTQERDNTFFFAAIAITSAMKGYNLLTKNTRLTFKQIWYVFEYYVDELFMSIREWCDVGTEMWMEEDAEKLTDEQFEKEWKCKKPVKKLD